MQACKSVCDGLLSAAPLDAGWHLSLSSLFWIVRPVQAVGMVPTAYMHGCASDVALQTCTANAMAAWQPCAQVVVHADACTWGSRGGGGAAIVGRSRGAARWTRRRRLSAIEDWYEACDTTAKHASQAAPAVQGLSKSCSSLSSSCELCYSRAAIARSSKQSPIYVFRTTTVGALKQRYTAATSVHLAAGARGGALLAAGGGGSSGSSGAATGARGHRDLDDLACTK